MVSRGLCALWGLEWLEASVRILFTLPILISLSLDLSSIPSYHKVRGSYKSGGRQGYRGNLINWRRGIDACEEPKAMKGSIISNVMDT